jgi:hypothetical protein
VRMTVQVPVYALCIHRCSLGAAVPIASKGGPSCQSR